ncbi:MAG: cytochrome c maturation protein CcmE [Candidatus Neomarinimicrobiota bacterium]|nr:MAG: cytochrome c maturation protein CcmE [Candidatus Neomarinimicrobiota bacterium]
MNSRRKFVVVVSGLIVLVFFWIYWVSTGTGSDTPTMVHFLSIEDLKELDSPTRVKLGGYVQEGSINISDTDLLDASFVLDQGDETIPVRYRGTRPDLFKDGAEVIVEGEYIDGVFQADMLQTKCASRYEGDLRDEASGADPMSSKDRS